MSGPVFKLQIVHPDGTSLVIFEGAGPVERALVASVADAVYRDAMTLLPPEIVKQGVGFFRTEAQVTAAIAAVFAAQLRPTVEVAVQKMLFDLKRETLNAI